LKVENPIEIEDNRVAGRRPSLQAIGEPTCPPRAAAARGPPQPTDAGAEPLPLWLVI
jgi:hypothetical protein